MRKPPTGEPYAGKPHVRFGGRGGLRPFPTPISEGKLQNRDIPDAVFHLETTRQSNTLAVTPALSRGPIALSAREVVVKVPPIGIVALD